MSTRLYYEDAYRQTFSAEVQQRRLIESREAVSLNETLFYPTSGGQMHDTGWLNDIPVVDVLYQDEEIWHILASPLAGDRIAGRLNWPRRFDFMQQHTAFHVLAGSFKKLFNIETLASHLGEEESTIEIAAGEFAADDTARLEEYANQVIYENRPVRAFFVNQAETANLALRKTTEMNEPVRLVEIEQLDLDPCGGTHVSSTGQVGMIKVTGRERVRGHVRLSFVAGTRCRREMGRLQEITQQLAGRFTTRVDALVAAVEKMQAENRELRKKMQSLSRTLAENALPEITAAACSGKAVVRIYSDLSADDLRWLAGTAVRQQPGIYLLANQSQPAALVFSSADQRIDLRSLFKTILPLVNGKGGGDAGFVQGAATAIDQLAAALEQAGQEVERLLQSDDKNL